MVTIVIPSHNRCQKLTDCLGHIYRSEGCGDFRVVVVLDGCTDGSKSSLAELFPGVIVLEGPGNLWWSGAINLGLEVATARGSDFALLLNDDVEIAPTALKYLLLAASEKPDSLIGSLILFSSPPQTIWCSGGAVNWAGRGTYMLKSGQSASAGATGILPAAWLPGMGTLIPASLLRRLGGMDANAFPQYFGDTDFCLRAAKSGCSIYVCLDSILINDTTLTGVNWSRVHFSWHHLSELLLSIRSHANIPTRFRFWLRHCPWYLIPIQVLRFYGPLFLSVMRALVFPVSRAGSESRR